jgi:methylthioribulose-1-phosphate dehydratase
MIPPCLDVQIPMSKTFPTVDPAVLAERADAIANAARELAAFGWTPATSSNFSMRIDEELAAITISGRDKGRLGREDIMVVDMAGKAVGSDHRRQRGIAHPFPHAERGLAAVRRSGTGAPRRLGAAKGHFRLHHA